MDVSGYKGVFVFIEQNGGRIHNVGLELLGKARELADRLNTGVTAVLPGYSIGGGAARLADGGADRVVLIDDPALDVYMTEPYARALTAVIEEYKPEIFLLGATPVGRDLAPRVSARVGTGLTADCTGLEIQDGTNNLLMTRPAFGGNLMAQIVCAEHRPQMATVRPGVMIAAAHGGGEGCEIIDFRAPGLENAKNVEILEVVEAIGRQTDIQDAKVLVAGGRGMGGADNFRLLEDLAGVLGGTVAASRAAVDAGWQEKDRQVGQTGKTVRPGLYIACGISGAIQHLAGMEESGVIVAINKDETAPIFDVADYGLVGDVLKVVPLLTEALRNCPEIN